MSKFTHVDAVGSYRMRLARDDDAFTSYPVEIIRVGATNRERRVKFLEAEKGRARAAGDKLEKESLVFVREIFQRVPQKFHHRVIFFEFPAVGGILSQVFQVHRTISAGDKDMQLLLITIRS